MYQSINPVFLGNFNRFAIGHLSQYARYRVYSPLMDSGHAAWTMPLASFPSKENSFT